MKNAFISFLVNTASIIVAGIFLYHLGIKEDKRYVKNIIIDSYNVIYHINIAEGIADGSRININRLKDVLVSNPTQTLSLSTRENIEKQIVSFENIGKDVKEALADYERGNLNEHTSPFLSDIIQFQSKFRTANAEFEKFILENQELFSKQPTNNPPLLKMLSPILLLLFFCINYYWVRRYIFLNALDNYHDSFNFPTISERFPSIVKTLLRWGAWFAAAKIISRHSQITNRFKTLHILYVILSEKTTADCITYFADCSYSAEDSNPKTRYWFKFGRSTGYKIQTYKDDSAWR